MSYENPRQPEGINVRDDHPLRDFFSLLLVLLIIVVTTVFALTLAAERLVHYIPFATEQRIVEAVGVRFGDFDPLADEAATTSADERAAREKYLRLLADRLAEHMEMPADMTFTVHYSPSDTLNAYATLGGHVVLFQGLIEKLPNENALAMVLAHEMAHVKLRHPIVAMSRGLTVAIAVGSILGFTDNAASAQLVQWLGITTAVSFSRDQERAADALAADVLIAEYGHLHGANDLFKALSAGAEGAQGVDLPPLLTEFAATHPALAERIETIDARAAQLETGGATSPLPELMGGLAPGLQD